MSESEFWYYRVNLHVWACRTAAVLQSHPDSLTRIVPTRVPARLCARIRDKIDGAPTAPRQDFPRVTGPLYFLVTTPASFFLYFLFSASSSRFLRATGLPRGRFRLSSIRSHPAILLLLLRYSSLLLRLFLLILLFLLATVLDAVQVQSERRDTTPTFPWR